MIIGVTGPRPHRLIDDYANKCSICTWLRNELEKKFLEYKPDTVITGVAQGFDTIAALLAIDHGIPLIAAVPFIGQEKGWSKQAQELYNKILSHPKTIVKVICAPGVAKWKYQKRNEWIVNECDKLIGATDHQPSGTENCLNYARSIEKDIDIIDLKLYYK